MSSERSSESPESLRAYLDRLLRRASLLRDRGHLRLAFLPAHGALCVLDSYVRAWESVLAPTWRRRAGS